MTFSRPDTVGTGPRAVGRRRTVRIVTVASLVAAMLVMTGCSSPEDPRGSRTSATGSAASKNGDEAIRSDLAPLVTRYPQLSAAESAVWMSGTMGRSDIGPSTYWIDAVVVIPDAEMDALLATEGLGTVEPPPFVDAMASRVPSGPFYGGPALDELFSSNGYGATVALDPGTRTVVLSAVFGN